MAQLPLSFHLRPSPPTSPAVLTPKVWTVYDLQRELREGLEAQYRSILVEGEISNLQIHGRSGHAYFTLKDRRAQLKCVMWRDDLRRLRFRPEDGQEVTLRGRVTIYERGGSLQLSVVHIEPQGVGALQVEYEQRLEKLRAEGLTALDRKRPIPPFPRCIGVVTSPDGAALRDILRTLLRRDPQASVLIASTPVQGREAARMIAQAIKQIDQRHQCDVLLVARGGGSLEDLWCFNEEAVARAIANASVPVISGIGHETDTTLADLVADLRASTPTAAAEIALKPRAELAACWQNLRVRMDRAFQREVTRSRQKLLELTHRLRGPESAIHKQAQRLDELTLRMDAALRHKRIQAERKLRQLEQHLIAQKPSFRLQAWAHRLQRAHTTLRRQLEHQIHEGRQTLGLAAHQLEALSPLRVLGRGYALVRAPDGQIVQSAAAVKNSERLEILLRDGRLHVTVHQTDRATPRPGSDLTDPAPHGK